MIPIFSYGSRRFKGVPSGTGDFLRLLVGELGTPKLAQIFAYGKWLYPYRMQLHGALDLDQRCLKMRNSEDGCTFPPNIFVPTPKITPKHHFGGPFIAKPIIHGALRKSHVNGATKLKLYSYIGVGKYLGNGVCQNFSARDCRAPQCKFGTPILSRKLLAGARKLKLKTQLDVVKYSLRGH